jgi:uncharacterized protein with ParB-like and HNH nuclease domain
MEEPVEVVPSEVEDAESSPAGYEIVTYPTDFTLQVIVAKLGSQIIVPEFQRAYVWKLPQASKLIESFLLGLPVPPIYLYSEAPNRQLLIDGQQRLKSVAYFFEGFFGAETKGKRPIFRLTGLNEKSPFFGLTYKDLETSRPKDFSQLNDAVLRSFVVKQLNPSDHTSVFHIFERLNTGGSLLRGQEVRNCVYYGPFIEMLESLNENRAWRKIFGPKHADPRKRDVELILRFLALRTDFPGYKKPMKDFLNNFSDTNRRLSKAKRTEFEQVFISTSEGVLNALGEKPFHIRAGLNAAVYDSVFVAVSEGLKKIPKDLAKRYQRLLVNKDFLVTISSGTTDDETIKVRLRIARETLLG